MTSHSMKDCLKQLLIFSYDNHVKIDMSFVDGSLIIYLSKRAIDGQIYKVSNQLFAADLMTQGKEVGFYDIFGGMLQRLLRDMDRAVYSLDDGYIGKVGSANDK